MLKGVNRKIIEVRDPDSRYFERAILFVRQGDWAPKEIDEQAEQYLRAASERWAAPGQPRRPPPCSRSRSGSESCCSGPGRQQGCCCWQRRWCCSEAVRLGIARRFQNLSNFDQTTCGSWICGWFLFGEAIKDEDL